MTSLEFSNGPLENRNLRDRVARALQFCSNLVFKVGRIADAVDEEIEKSFGREQALGLEVFHGVVTHRHIRAADVKDHIIVTLSADTLKT